MPTRILLEGRPGAGKTTALRRLAALLPTRAATGFTTEEIRQSGARVGFALETLAGRRQVLAHVDLPGPPRVGKYGVDLGVMERLALPSLRSATSGEATGRPVHRLPQATHRHRGRPPDASQPGRPARGARVPTEAARGARMASLSLVSSFRTQGRDSSWGPVVAGACCGPPRPAGPGCSPIDGVKGPGG
ncbi:nucleoside-triphosphatase [Streptomyces sp. NPDC097617]|uniref:nucleoside-triphosphatase n=1 Tax=Streptomyces sp. NPDC097617 TaxID=3366091 RepID=UPI00381F2184